MKARSESKEETIANLSWRPMIFTLCFAFALTALLLTAFTGRADAAAKIKDFSVQVSTTQAGGHPDLATTFEVETHQFLEGAPDPCLCQSAKEVAVEFPAGVIGNPHSAPRCTESEFATNACPVDSQVGVVVARLAKPEAEGGPSWVSALFNMVPKPNQAGLLAWPAPLLSSSLGSTPIFVEITARTESDYGLEVKATGITRIAPPSVVTTLNWGVPAATKHDALRFPYGDKTSAPISGECFKSDQTPAVLEDVLPSCLSFAPRPSNSPAIPFTSNPTTCSGPLTITIDVLSYDLGTDHAETEYPETTGCGLLRFDPSQSAKPTTTQADTPSGLDLQLSVPQFQSATTPSPSEIRAATVEFPPGFTINPNAADGKVDCSDTAARMGTRAAAECPEFAKVGTLSIDSSALPGLIYGYAYIGSPLPGERYRAILVADGFGLHFKFSGSIAPDPQTGQLTARFPDLPQSPFQEFNLHLFGGERGIFATMSHCGTYPVESTFVPWASELAAQTSTQFFTIDSGPAGRPCPSSSRPFAPEFSAGALDSTAGVHAPVTFELNRNDGDQSLSGLTVITPRGFSAVLKGIPYCPEAAIDLLAFGSYTGFAEQSVSACPSASQIGTVTTGAGSGTRPLYSHGKAYLAGPYKGAPLSLVVVVPAVSGPYDLGNVAVRAAIRVDPVSVRVSAISDPLPQIIGGIPLRARSIRVDLDRPDFALNPTNCERSAALATISGDQGAVADVSSPFQVSNCGALPFGPELSVRLTGGLNRRGHPAIHSTLETGSEEANLRRISVTLPRGELLDNSHIGAVCTRVAFAKDACPASARIGRAEATTPLLDDPLKGSVYLRSSSHELPDMALDLDGQIDIEAVARIDSVNGRLRATFEAIPDAPVSSVKLNLLGGSKGLLQNTISLCGVAKKATVFMIGQNGKRVTRRVPLHPACGGSSHNKRQRHGSSSRPGMEG